MTKQNIKLVWVSLVLTIVAIFLVKGPLEEPAITGMVVKGNGQSIVTASINRQGDRLKVTLSNFPSYESYFKEPNVSKFQGGQTVVSLRSYLPGLFGRKSEQLTDLSFFIPAQSLPSGSKIVFRSDDYDQDFTSAYVP